MSDWTREPLEDSELNEFLRTADDLNEQTGLKTSKYALVPYGLAYTGMRADALAHMKSSWVSFQRDEINVPKRQKGTTSEDLKRREKLVEQYERVDGDLAQVEDLPRSTESDDDRDSIESFDIQYLADLLDRLGRRTVREIVEEWPEDVGLWVPKTKSGARTIPLRNPDLIRHLRNWFSNHESVGMTRQTVYNIVVEVAEQTNITKKTTPHICRHTFLTKLAANGATAGFIKDVAGHEDLKTSQKYIKFSGRRIQEEADSVMF